MIISYRHEYIFVHCRKVAGSSITAFLSQFHGPQDIQVGAWPDAWAHDVYPNKRFFLDLLNPKSITAFLKKSVVYPRVLSDSNVLMQELNRIHKDTYQNALGYNPPHPLAKDLRTFDPEAWSNFFKFCFVRNPYEKVVSDYLWRKKITGQTDTSFNTFLKLMESDSPQHEIIPYKKDNWPMYTINDQIAVDYIGHYKFLNEHIKKICKKLDLPYSGDLFPQAKQSKSYDYKSFYGKEEKRLVERLFHKEINYFNYTF